MGENLSGCSPCCSVPSVVEVPGVEGSPGTTGTAGINGISAVGSVASDFTVPSVGNDVAITISTTSPYSGSTSFSEGEPFFIFGAGFFQVISISGFNQIIAQYLDYSQNINSGVVISAGTKIVPSGLQPAAPTSLPLITFYGIGGSQNLTTSPAQILSSTITLAASSYLLSCTANIKLTGATYAANQVLTVKIRRTNNSATDISNAVTTFTMPIVTTITETLGIITIPQVSYSATNGDILQVFASVGVTPSAGNVQAVEVSLVATPVS